MDIKAELIKTGNQIREKYRALKRGRRFIEDERIENFKPITEPLKELVESQKQFPIITLPIESAPKTLPELQPPPGRYLQIGSIARNALSKFMTKKGEADSTYGLRYENLVYKIGDKVAEIKDNDIKIDNVLYRGTPGLWELIVSKQPQTYTEADIATYKKILLQTNAHKKGYKSDAPLSANKYYKYTKIIKPLFADIEEIVGQGILTANENKVDYKYWKDPNELVDRLRLLYYSQSAGNTGVHNEMEAIKEELLEKKIIFSK